MGWPTGGDAGVGFGGRAVSETVQGKYVPRTFFEFFRQGVQRTYWYELVDEQPAVGGAEGQYGVVRNDGSLKPAAVALKNIIAQLRDGGGGRRQLTSSAVAYTLGGGTAGVHHLLLQKSDGSRWLALWLEVPSTDAPQARLVSVGIPARSSAATLYSLDDRGMVTTASPSVTGGTLSVPVSDAVSLIRF